MSQISQVTQNTEQPPSQTNVIRRENQVLKEQLLHLDQQLFFIEKEKEAQTNTINDLQNYLNLFLTHPVYRIYKFLKNLLRTTPEPGAVAAPAPANSNYEEFQRYSEPSSDDLNRFASESESLPIKPELDVVTVVRPQPPWLVQQTILSVLTQTYRRWTLLIADASQDKDVGKYLSDLSKKEPRIKLHSFSESGSCRDLLMAKGSAEFILLLDSGDHLAPHALHEVAAAILQVPDVDLLYSDSDKLNQEGRRCDPFFKPDWSPETMLSVNLANHLGTFRRSLLNQLAAPTFESDEAQDWDLFLRLGEKARGVHHIPHVLYHRNASQANPATIAVSRILCEHLKRLGIQEPAVAVNSDRSVQSITWKPCTEKRISIIIPSRDHLDVLQPCLESIFGSTEYSDYEVILVDTGSVSDSTWEFYKRIADHRFKQLACGGDFNFSAACNTGARTASGDLFLFLNNDTQVLQKNWLSRMSQWFDLPGTGIVGCKLIYPDGRLQHAGVIVGMGGFAWHLFHQRSEPIRSLFGNCNWYCNFSAVTAACMMISREAFEKAQGFDEGFRINFGDIDLCLRTLQAGYRIVFTPDVNLIHHESVTRRRHVPRSDFDLAYERWFPLIERGDPYFNPNLSYKSGWPEFKLGDDDTPGTINDSIRKRLPKKEMLLLPEDFG